MQNQRPRMPGSQLLADFSRRSTESLHEWAVWKLERGTFTDPEGGSFERTYVLSPGAVAVVPLRFEGGDAWVTLVRQYRPAFDKQMLEIPAGMRDIEGESPETTAARELLEETGLIAGQLDPLGRMASAPGITNSEVIIFLGTQLTAGKPHRHGPEEPHLDMAEMTLGDALATARDGLIDDSKTMVGLLLASETIQGDNRK